MTSNSETDSTPTEPLLKYHREKISAHEIITKDSISCVAVHSKFLVLGTEWGNIYVLDHFGNKTFKSHINAHSTVINQISIDNSGEYIASCSNDGKVLIFGLSDEKQLPGLNLSQEIKAVAISHNYKRTFQFVTGDTRLILVSKGLLSSQKMKVLQEHKSLIRNIKWNHDNIIYATDDSAFVFDLREERLIGIIEPDKTNLLYNKADFYCRITWVDRQKFLIGWGHLVQICRIKDNPNYASPVAQIDFRGSSRLNLNAKKVESLNSFLLPELILGLVPYDKRILIILYSTDTKSSEEIPKSSTLIEILEPDDSADGFTPLSYEQMFLKDVEINKSHRVHLEKVPYENEFYIVSPKDLISVKEKEIDDRIEWLMKNMCYEKALELAKNFKSNLNQYSYKDIGLKYIDYLLITKDYKKAAELCPTIVDDNESWENVITKFLKCGHIKDLISLIPCSEGFKLNPKMYLYILEYQHNHNLEAFLSLLRKWSPTLYSINEVKHIIYRNEENKKLIYRKPTDKLTETMVNREKTILECLAILSEHNKEYEESLDLYIRLKHGYVFELIKKRKLFDYVKKKLVFLFNYNKEMTLNILMDYINDIPPEVVVKILSGTPIFLCHYLHTLFKKNTLASEPYHLKMVDLYAEFKPESLLSFLRASDKYDLNMAIELCEKKEFNEEVIYLLGRIGKSKEALKKIMSQQNSVSKAIDYCCERNDDELWQQLLNYSITKPDFIKAILESTRVEINMETFIRQILTSNEIPGLRDSLVVLLTNNEKRNNLISAHQMGKWNDIFHMIETRIMWSKKSIVCHFADNRNCIICEKSIINFPNEFILFPCSHLCHEVCIQGHGNVSQLFCRLCNE